MPIDWWAENALATRRKSVLLLQKPEEVTVEVWLCASHLLFPSKAGPSTVRNVQCQLMPFRREYGTWKMQAVTGILAQAWTMEHPSQVKFLRAAFRRAEQLGVIARNPWEATEAPPNMKPKPRPPTTVELEGILATVRSRAVGDLRGYGWFEAFVEVAAFTGARQIGLRRLRWKDVRLDDARVLLHEKGGKDRTIFLPVRAVAALRLHREREHGLWRERVHHQYPVFSDSFMRKLDRQVPGVLWCEVRGDFPFGLHALRHYAATWMAEAGVDPLDIAVQLGHTDAHGRPYDRLVKRTYDHPDPELALGRVGMVLDAV